MLHPERWGKLRERYEAARPRKMLAVDGGGIRGVLSLGILRRMEELLRVNSGLGEKFRLCDYFDYIAGTSTGAIIAAGLARGMSVGQLVDFYKTAGPDMFEKARLDRRIVSFYTADPLREELKKCFDATLAPDDLRCLLLVVTRNATTDSPWPISSNPDARYNDPGRRDCNLRIPLWKLVRASTAAPIYFPPEIVAWDPTDALKTFVFVDGGVTPYNNPAFLLFRMATHPAYRLGWKTGERDLLLVSVGTGSAATLSFKTNVNIAANLAGLPGTLMYGVQVEQDINCRITGRCTYGNHIDRELRDLTCRTASDDCTLADWEKSEHVPLERDLGRAFLYARYDADLSRESLDQIGFADVDPKKVQELDAVDQIDNLLRIGAAVGQRINLKHFGSFV